MSEPTRAVAVVNRFPSASETFIERKLVGLRDAGLDVAVAAWDLDRRGVPPGIDALALVDAARPLHTIAQQGIGGSTALVGAMLRRGPSSRRRRALVAPIAAARPDLVHFELSGIAVRYSGLLAALRPAKLVVSCRGTAERVLSTTDAARADAMRRMFEQVDLVHCVSDDMAATVARLGADPARTFVNRPAIPVADFELARVDRSARRGPLRVASVGRLEWVKGLDEGIRAVARAARAGSAIEYRIAGEGPDREKLQFLASELGVAGVVQLLGRADQRGVVDLLRWSDVLLLPSWSEGISNAALEAMAAGVPVVATRTGGMAEVIEAEVDGVLVEVGDLESMASALVGLAADPVRRARLGAAAAQRADRSFDLSGQIASFVAAYEGLLRG